MCQDMRPYQIPNLMAALNEIIFQLINSQVSSERITGIAIIDRLLAIDIDEVSGKFSHFTALLRLAFESNDQQVLNAAAPVFGKLAKLAGNTVSETLEIDLKRALNWLPLSDKKYAAVLLLKELAINAEPTFFVHVANFVDKVWNVISDKNIVIRVEAYKALQACFAICKKRENSTTEWWYHQLYTKAESAVGTSSTENLHGALLVFDVLLCHAKKFCQSRYKSITEKVFALKDSKDKVVRKMVISILPQIARFEPSFFAQTCLGSTVEYLITQIDASFECDICFVVLGEISLVVGAEIRPHLQAILETITANIFSRTKNTGCIEALTCAAMVSQQVDPEMAKATIGPLVLQMIESGLTPQLVASLQVILKSFPKYIPEMAIPRLFDLINSVLETVRASFSIYAGMKKKTDTNHYSRCLTVSPALLWSESSLSSVLFENTVLPSERKISIISRTRSPSTSTSEVQGMAQTEVDIAAALLCMKTLSTMDFSMIDGILLFIKNNLFPFLEVENFDVRLAATITCAHLAGIRCESGSLDMVSVQTVGEIVHKLLIMGITDPNPTIRCKIFTVLDKRFDFALVQPDILRSLFIALNDEVLEVREKSVSLIGSLATKNPSFIMPVIRKTLVQLLNEMEYGDSRTKESAATLLGTLIRSCESLMTPYVDSILKALLPKLHPSTGISQADVSVLAALGSLAPVATDSLSAYIDDFVPIITAILHNQSAYSKVSSRKEVALKALASFLQSTGHMQMPIEKHLEIFDMILQEFVAERNPSVREEYLKVLGILGALDPASYKQMLVKNRKKQQEEYEEAGMANMNGDVPTVPSSNELYYPTVVVNVLLKILRNPNLTVHHKMALKDLVSTIGTLRDQATIMLPYVVPVIFNVMRNADVPLREACFQHFGTLVSVVKGKIREYMKEALSILGSLWETSEVCKIITLVEEMSTALGDEFRVYLPTILPLMLRELSDDKSEQRTNAKKVIHCFDVFGNNLEEYMPLVVPSVMNFIEDIDTPVDAAEMALDTLVRLLKKLNFSDISSRIIHSVLRTLERPDKYELRDRLMQMLCVMVRRLRTDYSIFIPTVSNVLARNHVIDAEYDMLIQSVLRNEHIEDDDEKPSQQLAQESGERTPRKMRASSRILQPLAVPDMSLTPDMLKLKKLAVNDTNLKTVWDNISRCVTKDDWTEWLRQFCLGFLRESTSPVLRSCLGLALEYHPLTRELFNAAFLSCWIELSKKMQDALVRTLNTALCSPSIPSEVMQALLNLAEYMEHEEMPLPILCLGSFAKQCRAYAKALYWKEQDFFSDMDADNVADLIAINSQMQHREAAIGIIRDIQKKHKITLQEGWYEKLGHWEDALSVYEQKVAEGKQSIETTVGRMRCLNALSEWEVLGENCRNEWVSTDDPMVHMQIAPYASAAAWHTGNWNDLETYVKYISDDKSSTTFYKIALNIHNKDYVKAELLIKKQTENLGTELVGLLSESYDRAYSVAMRLQQLAEFGEVIQYASATHEKKERIKERWKNRLEHCQNEIYTWESILSVHSLVLSPHEEEDLWLRFAGLCRKNGRYRQAFNTIDKISSIPVVEENLLVIGSRNPRLAFSYLKTMWASARARGESTLATLSLLGEFRKQLIEDHPRVNRKGRAGTSKKDDIYTDLLARVNLVHGRWQYAETQQTDTFNEMTIPSILSSFRQALENSKNWYKAWHWWAIINFEVISHNERKNVSPSAIIPYVITSIHAFFRSISIAPEQPIQDILRVLSLMFKYSSHLEVENALIEGFGSVSIDTWLQVIPQLMARINSPSDSIRRLTHRFLMAIGKDHPHALVYPLTVASHSQNVARLTHAVHLKDKLREAYPVLVDQADLVSTELIRVAIIWHEMWKEGLEEASRYYFQQNDVDGMYQVLAPLHKMIEAGPRSLREVSFVEKYGRDLHEAFDFLKKYRRLGISADLQQAWYLYCCVFRQINAKLPKITRLRLEDCSPQLQAQQDMELPVPGTYKSGSNIVRIARIDHVLRIIASKQRPRKLTIVGTDNVEYKFLLKGHEDLRQDERVMQLFSLVNTLLDNNAETSKSNLNIATYAVIPLSPNSGLIGWVPNTDTINALIRQYRENHKIPLMAEQEKMRQLCPMYDLLTIQQKVEILQLAMSATDGNDLSRAMWLQSATSEQWLGRRTNYTRSVAVMSMVGYILGLGDRHLSNLMVDQESGRVVHIDFGDCFEVAMNREKYPEKIPFRLTRMLVKAMEASGIEGNYRFTCEKVMSVLRENKDSVMAVLEAFVYDPLFNWDALKNQQPGQKKTPNTLNTTVPEMESVESNSEKTLDQSTLLIIKRVTKKLTGRDFGREPLMVNDQVDRLIKEATDIENLCQMYIGWCPFW